MILQQILTAGTENVLLYYRSAGRLTRKEDALIFDRNAVFSTDTYLNAFSVGKWCTYCRIDRLRLAMEMKGQFRLRIVRAYEENDAVKQETVWEKDIVTGRGKVIWTALPQPREGVLFFSLQAAEQGAEFYRAWYECEDVFDRDITLALNICTFRREPYLLRNLELLQGVFLKDRTSPLYGRLKIFITDNGKTLDIPALSDENVHVCHNPNVGGAGGFTRGLLEILQRAGKERITNVIFMDDDVEILPESLLRTYRLLKVLKEEYQDAFIGGALLRLDKPYIQHENGALWNLGKCVPMHSGLDFRRFENVVRNEQLQKLDYAAWWYCCVPVSVVRRDNLPLPVFIHRDDVEYSLRNAGHIITVNGVAVRHPIPENKKESSNVYYDIRNMLIVNTRYAPEYRSRQLRKKMFITLLMSLLRYRYKNMHLAYMGLRDFCKGPDWLLQLDAPSYHKEIQQRGYHFQDMGDRVPHDGPEKKKTATELDSMHDIFAMAKETHSVGKLLFQMVSLNGWLLPPKKETYVCSMGVHPVDLFRTGKVILYDDVSGQGIEVRKSFLQIPVFVWLYLKSLMLISFRYEKSKKAYRERFGELQGIQYWNRVLYGDES